MKCRKDLHSPPSRLVCIAGALPLPSDATTEVEPGSPTRTAALSRNLPSGCASRPKHSGASCSVPSERLNAYLKDIGGVHFYSPMPTEHRAVLAGVPDLPVTDLSHFLTDFSRTAAATQCLDEIVSVRTSSANLAGALGLKTHVLLQKHADWRWFGDTAWYPDVVTYRQEARADWGTCLQALSANWR